MRWPLVLATCMGFGLASAARAQPPSDRASAPPRPTLVVRVTEACPAATGAEQRFATVIAATERERGEVRVEITESTDGFTLHFFADLPEGQTERELQDPDCAALLSASVLLAAIALDVPIEAVMAEVEPPTDPGDAPPPQQDPTRLDPDGTSEPAPEQDPGAGAEPQLEQGPDTAGTSPVERQPAPRWGTWAHASVGLGSRFLPALRPDGGVGLALFQARPRAALGLVGAFRWTGPEATSAARSGVSARARALGAELGACLRQQGSGWALDGCLGGRLWRVRGQGVGSDADRQDHALDVALVAQVGLNVALHPRVGLRAAFGGVGHVLRARLNVAGVGTLHTAPALQVEGSLALWVRLSAAPTVPR